MGHRAAAHQGARCTQAKQAEQGAEQETKQVLQEVDLICGPGRALWCEVKAYGQCSLGLPLLPF